ncbi:MAG TPA: prepilin-type N-terminal cleavage/methylation domain-containing protein, partial [Cellvibrionaceae bacterium]|nr:prepilin-type N-terminal cleavage/methylation domain-containing protein [Cellvibrionaceae bacterium]
MKAAAGFTLVEILIAVALIATLAFAVVPLGTSWTTSAESVNTKGVLSQAISRAKSTALRNGNKISETNAVTAVCLSSGKVEVREASGTVTSAHCASNGGSATWSNKIGTTLTIKNNNQALSCMCFSSKGLLVTTPSNCTSCATSSTFEFSGSG